MAEATKSLKLLHDFRDDLRDHAKIKEPSDGAIFRKMSEGQLYFMEHLKTTKLPLLLPLFTGQTEYPIPDNVLEVVDVIFDIGREHLNPLWEIPNTSTSKERYILITDPPGYETANSDTTRNPCVMDGDKCTLEVFWKPNDDTVIDETHNPEIESTFHNLLKDYALSYYRDFEVWDSDNADMKRYRNPGFKTKEEVIKEVRRKRDRMYGTNSIQSVQINFVRF